MKSNAEELTDLLAIGGGDRERAAGLVADIMAGKLCLPPCFNVRGGTTEQTARAHELARMLTAN
jgi:hypothetical protein